MNELELFDDFVAEDVIPKDVEKQIMNELLSKLDELTEVTHLVGNNPAFKIIGIISNQQAIKLLNIAAETCAKYNEYTTHCQQNMEM